MNLTVRTWIHFLCHPTCFPVDFLHCAVKERLKNASKKKYFLICLFDSVRCLWLWLLLSDRKESPEEALVM